MTESSDAQANDKSLPPPEPAEPTREKEVIEITRQIETPFIKALQREYGLGRGWRLCGPASIALSRILSMKTGIPIQLNGEGEHLELVLGVFDPVGDPRRLERIEEQTYIRYHTGTGSVYFIDPIYGLLMGGKKDEKGAIMIEKYDEGEIDQNLIEKHHIYPFDPDDPRSDHILDLHDKNHDDRVALYNDHVTALNDDRATMPEFLTDSGRVIHADTQRAESVIREFVPEWQIDNGARMKNASVLRNAILEEALKRAGIKITLPKTSS